MQFFEYVYKETDDKHIKYIMHILIFSIHDLVQVVSSLRKHVKQMKKISISAM